tara:strand:+ start:193 stop:456 length:264 start_codon:yes stop_codon:yes gene_type:complete
MTVVPDWKEMGSVLRWILSCSFIGFMMSLVAISCADEWYFGKSREELTREMFIVDSLIMDIQYQLDSTSIDFEKFYIDAQKINNGHN